MKTFLLIVGGVVVIVAAFVAWRLWATLAGGRKAYLRLAAQIRPVEDRLVAGQEPEPTDLERFASNRETRKVLYDALERHGKLQLFPARYLTVPAMAEADLVAWLCHPNELGAPPDEIELMAQVPAPGGDFAGQDYFVFRYRTKPPHWAAKDGWLAGTAGPYATGVAASAGAGTFSRFEAFDSRTPAEHVRLVHGQVTGRR